MKNQQKRERENIPYVSRPTHRSQSLGHGRALDTYGTTTTGKPSTLLTALACISKLKVYTSSCTSVSARERPVVGAERGPKTAEERSQKPEPRTRKADRLGLRPPWLLRAARAARSGSERVPTSPYPLERLYASRCSGGVAAVRVGARVRVGFGSGLGLAYPNTNPNANLGLGPAYPYPNPNPRPRPHLRRRGGSRPHLPPPWAPGAG